LSFWFKTTEGGPILWQGNNLGGFSAAIHSAATGGEGVYKGRGIFYIDRPGSAFGKMTQQVYNDGVWHNYTAVLDGYATTEVPASLMKIFIDGVYVPQDEILMNQSSVSLPASPDFPFWFGKAAVDYTFYFKGVLDDIAIWNRPLSSDEIQKIYNGDGF